MTIQRWRLLSRVILILLVTVHLITWYALGIHAVGSIGIEALFAGLSFGIINAGFVFWMLVFASALLLGRAFCGWFCWFGGYQELVAWGIGDRFKIKMPRGVLLYLGAIPFVSLVLKLYYTWIVNWFDGVPSTFRFDLANVEPWGGQQTGLSILITLVLYGPVLILIFGQRAWCRHLCPIGALLKIFSLVRPARVRLVTDGCLGCGKCVRVCDMEIDVVGELERYGEVRSTNCNVCLQCINQCPNDAIAFTLRRTDISMHPDAADRASNLKAKRRRPSAFDAFIALSWISVVLVFSLAGLQQNAPQAIKTLMTPGLLLVFYGLALIGRKVWNRYGKAQRTAGNS